MGFQTSRYSGITVLVLLLRLASTSVLANGLSKSTEDILIGGSNAQSGASSSLGKQLVVGSRAYFDWVNARGGVAGRHIRLIVKDDRYEPEPAVNNTNQLITQDKVLFLFDYVGTPTLTRVLPLLRFYEAEGIINLAPMTGAAPQRRPPYDYYVFNIRASYAEEAEALVEHLYRQGCRRFGFLGQSDAYGKSGEVAVEAALRHHSLSLVSTTWYRRGVMFRTTSTMEPQVEELRRNQPDAIIVFGVYGPCARFIRDARMAHWDVPIANVSFVGADILLAQLHQYAQEDHRDFTANLLNSEVVPSPDHSNVPLARDFRNHAPANAIDYIAFEGWLDAVVAVEALRRAGPAPTRSSFRQALESLHDWDAGLGVPLAFSPQVHQALHAVWVTETREGKWVSVGELNNGSYEKHSR